MLTAMISKRQFLKTILVTGLSMTYGVCRAKGVTMAKPKILVVYFSWSGSTKEAAERIHSILGGEIARIETVVALPNDYEAVVKVHKAQTAAQEHPALKPLGVNVSDYDVICLGHSIWSGKLPMPVRSFLDKADLKGKTLLHFACHGGSGLGQSQKELSDLLPETKLLPGLALYGWGGLRDADRIQPWLERLGFLPER